MTPADKRTARDLLERAEQSIRDAERSITSSWQFCLCESIRLVIAAVRTVVNGVEGSSNAP